MEDSIYDKISHDIRNEFIISSKVKHHISVDHSKDLNTCKVIVSAIITCDSERRANVIKEIICNIKKTLIAETLITLQFNTRNGNVDLGLDLSRCRIRK